MTQPNNTIQISGSTGKTITLAPLLILLGINLLLILGPFFLPVAPGNDWYKGPLVDPVSPYASANAWRMLGICLAAFFDLCLLLTFIFFYLLRNNKYRRRMMPMALLASIVIGFLSVEAGLRVYLAANVRTMFEPDPVLFWRLTPNLDRFNNEIGGEIVSTNSLGWRAPEVPAQKQANEFRVLALGDSSNYGLGVEENQTWEKVLEKKLAQVMPNRKVTVFNASCPGHTTHQGRLLLQRYSPLVQPDLVISGYNNDPAPEFFTDKEREGNDDLVRNMRIVAFHSRLFILLRQVTIGIWRGTKRNWESPDEGENGDGRSMKPRVPLDEFVANLGDMIAQANADGYTIVFLRMPVDLENKKFVSRFYDPKYPEALLTTDAPVVDLHSAWLKANIRDFLPGHLFHPNISGHNRIAEQVFENISTLGLLGQKAKGTIPIRIGYSKITPLHCLIGEVLKRTAIPAKHGFSATFESFLRGSDQAEATTEIDATFSCEVPAVMFLEAENNWRIAGSTGRLGVIGIVAHEKLNLSELRGKKIGVPFGSTPHMDLLRWAHRNHLNAESDVQMIDLGMSKHAAALSAKNVDAVAMWDPWVTQLRLKNAGKLIESRPFYSLILLKEPLLTQYPDASDNYLAAIREAILYARDHRDETLGWVAEASNIDRDVLAQVLTASDRLDEQKIDFVLTDQLLTDLRACFDFIHRDLSETESEHAWQDFLRQFVHARSVHLQAN